ncbi:hypothetical protein CCMSSC00406_0006300 [Pleurotus cornucopiae]|uniref:Uncharacterized protein n=1 Tax=Pleurotus cornucopiae TaxID=5321 RepID=A0ACB7J7F9_PLECO|nr:hypothetical protein CCMSSC00406_0006300 [Pleurotus cornucopiae]
MPVDNGSESHCPKYVLFQTPPFPLLIPAPLSPPSPASKKLIIGFRQIDAPPTPSPEESSDLHFRLPTCRGHLRPPPPPPSDTSFASPSLLKLAIISVDRFRRQV